MRPITIRLTDEIYQKLLTRANKKGETVSEAARTSLVKSFNEDERFTAEDQVRIRKIFKAFPYVLEETISAKLTTEILIKILAKNFKTEPDFIEKFLNERDVKVSQVFQEITEIIER